MTVASLASEKFNAVNAKSMLKHCAEEHFPKEKFPFAVVDGRHLR